MPDPGDAGNSGYIEAVRNFQAMHQQTIAEALSYIPNVMVSVHVDLDTLVQSREHERKFEKQFPVKNVEETENETSNETGPAGEPGMGANQPRALRGQVTNKNNRTVEKNRTATDSVPGNVRETSRQNIGFTPKAVQVAVAIPKDYYRNAAVAELKKEGGDEADKAIVAAKVAQLQAETERQVKDKIAHLIPTPLNGTAADNINVSSYTPSETVETAVPVNMATQAGEILTQWGGPAGLTLFALWTLWMLNRSAKRTAEGSSSTAAGKQSAGKAAAALAAAAEDEEEQLPKELTKRDKLQTLVKDNPEMAAAVLSRWLTPPK